MQSTKAHHFSSVPRVGTVFRAGRIGVVLLLLVTGSAGSRPAIGEAASPAPRPLRPNCWYLRSRVSDNKAVRVPANEGQSVAFLTWTASDGAEWISLGESPFVLALVPLGVDGAGGAARETRDGSGSIYAFLVQRHEVTRFDESSRSPAATRLVDEFRWTAPEKPQGGRWGDLFPARAMRFQAAPFRYCVLLHLRTQVEPLPAGLQTADRRMRMLGARVGVELAEVWEKPDPVMRLRYGQRDIQPSAAWYQELTVKAPWTGDPALWSGPIRCSTAGVAEFRPAMKKHQSAAPVSFDETGGNRAGAADGPATQEP